MSRNRPNFKSSKSTRDNFKTKLSSSAPTLNTMLIQNPLDGGTILESDSAVNNLKFMIWRNRFNIGGNHSKTYAFSHKFLDNFLVPTLYLLGQELSGYKINVTSLDVREYFNAVSHAMSVVYSFEQIVNYCEDSSTVNIGLQRAYKNVVTPDTIRGISDLKYALQQHFCPKGFHDYIVDYYTLRQSGDSSESCIIGNSCIDLVDAGITDMLSEIQICLDQLNTVSQSNATASFFTIINKINSKKELGWKISEWKTMPSVLTYEPEFIMRIANASKKLKTNGVINYVPMSSASTFLATVANPSVRAVLEIGLHQNNDAPMNDTFLPEFTSTGNWATNCMLSVNNLVEQLSSNDPNHIEITLAGCASHWTFDLISPNVLDSYKSSYLGGTVIRGYNAAAQESLYNAYYSQLWELSKLQS